MRPSFPLLAFALAIVSGLGIAGPARAQAVDEGASVEAVSAGEGHAPLYCAEVGPDERICTWHEKKRTHVVCEFADGVRTPRPCLRRADNESTGSSPRPGPIRNRSPKGPSPKELQAQATLEIDAARDVWALSDLVGAGPVRCRSGETLSCTWFAVRRTPGYLIVSRFARAPGKKLGLICTFQPDGTRSAGSCHAAAAGRPPAP